MREMINELRELIKDKGIISWTENVYVDDILDKYGLYDDQEKFIKTTTKVCMELGKEFNTLHVDNNIIFSVKHIKHYIKVKSLLSAKTKAELKLLLAIQDIEDLQESTIDTLLDLINGNNSELAKQTVFIVYED